MYAMLLVLLLWAVPAQAVQITSGFYSHDFITNSILMDVSGEGFRVQAQGTGTFDPFFPAISFAPTNVLFNFTSHMTLATGTVEWQGGVYPLVTEGFFAVGSGTTPLEVIEPGIIMVMPANQFPAQTFGEFFFPERVTFGGAGETRLTMDVDIPGRYTVKALEVRYQPTVVNPEPGTWTLWLIGLAGILLYRRVQWKRAAN